MVSPLKYLKIHQKKVIFVDLQYNIFHNIKKVKFCIPKNHFFDVKKIKFFTTSKKSNFAPQKITFTTSKKSNFPKHQKIKFFDVKKVKFCIPKNHFFQNLKKFIFFENPKNQNLYPQFKNTTFRNSNFDQKVVKKKHEKWQKKLFDSHFQNFFRLFSLQKPQIFSLHKSVKKIKFFDQISYFFRVQKSVKKSSKKPQKITFFDQISYFF